MDFLRTKFKEFWPKIQYDVFKYAFLASAPTMLAVLVYLLHLWKTVPSWIPAGVLFVVAACMFIWYGSLLLILLGRNSENSMDRLPGKGMSNLDPVASGPKPVDLQGKILELCLHTDNEWESLCRFYVLARVRIVNTGPDEATVTHWGMEISLGRYHETGVFHRVPDRWRIKKLRADDMYGELFDVTTISPQLGVDAHEEVYKKGIPHEGWVLFALLTSIGGQECPNAEFKINLVDSLGGKHSFRREAGVYRRTVGVVVDEV